MRLAATLGFVVALLFPGGAILAQATGDSLATSTVEVRQRPPIATLSGFVENRGQWAEDVLFLARQGGIEAVLMRDALLLHPLPRWTGKLSEQVRRSGRPSEPQVVPGPPLTIRLPAARAIEGEDSLPTAHHFLLGSGSTSNVPGYQRVVYRDVAPGIDIVVRAGAEWFAYDLQLRPGADLGALVLEIQGARAFELVDGHVLVMQTSAGRVEQRIEAAWQVDPRDGTQTQIASRFRLLGETDGRVRIGFEAPGRDPAAAFVLDPSLVFATYVGGTQQDIHRDMDVGPDGAVYLAVRSSNGPTTPGAFQPVPSAVLDAWVGKLSSDGSTLEWGTFLGGIDGEEVLSVDVDHDGSVVVGGTTWSPDFPVTQGSLDTTIENAPTKSDLFISRLASDGGSLLWSTFYGGPDHELFSVLRLSPTGDVLVFAEPFTAIPTATPGSFDSVYDSGDRMLVRLSADGTQLVFQTYFRAAVSDIAFDDDSNIYLTGSAGFLPTTPGAFQEVVSRGGGDAYATKMDPLGTELRWSTYLGGADGNDIGLRIAVDAAGAVYVVGHAASDSFPVTSGTTRGSPIGLNGFVTKLLPGGSGLVWSTTQLSACCGPGASTLLWGIALDPAGNVFVSGSSNRPDFPVTPDAFQSRYIGSSGLSDGHLSKLDAFGEALVYSTYFGGSSSDLLPRVGLDAAFDPYLVIQTTSSNIPVTVGAYDPEYSTGGDVAVAKFSGISLAPWRVRGGGVAGSVDTPNLAGAGALTPGSPTRLSVRGGEPSAPALLTVAFPAQDALSPLGNPTFAPTAAVILPVGTDADGALDLHFPWPGFPPGLRLVVQVRIAGVAPSTGWSATNELQLITQ